MTVKIGANNILYWGCNALLFFHRKLTDLELMAAVRPDVERMWAVTRRIEAMFREWNVLEHDSWVRGFVRRPKRFPAWGERQREPGGRLRRRAAGCQDQGERRSDGGIAVLLSTGRGPNLGDLRPREDVKINPYAVSLDPDRWEADGLFNGEGLSLVEARETPAAGMENLFMEAIAQPA